MGSAIFLVAYQDQEFRIRLDDPTLISQADQHMKDGRVGVMMGKILRGDGGFNQPWSWHHDPASIEFPLVAKEACDGLPQYVETHLDDFLRMGQYCPWGAQIISREDSG